MAVIASFSYSPISGNAPLSVKFTDTSMGATSWHWDFGDGASSIAQNPVHTYAIAGHYTPCLFISGSGIGASQAQRNVEVSDICSIPMDVIATDCKGVEHSYTDAEVRVEGGHVTITRDKEICFHDLDIYVNLKFSGAGDKVRICPDGIVRWV